ncbi:MAG: transglycosylase SLT domain-containing protein [Porticoccaceae bacterium]|nr:transglycosylase SLT domain-containing protein [Porticoccaceae bacterium]
MTMHPFRKIIQPLSKLTICVYRVGLSCTPWLLIALATGFVAFTHAEAEPSLLQPALESTQPAPQITQQQRQLEQEQEQEQKILQELEAQAQLIAAQQLEKQLQQLQQQHLRQRPQYRAAVDALREGDTASFLQLKEQLITYPLFPYLEYEYLKHQPYAAAREDIKAFLQNYNDAPVARSLRISLLNSFYRQQRWTEFRNYYDPELNHTALKCQFQEALYHTGVKDQSIAAGLKLWNVDKSQPSGCDSLFKLMSKAGAITEALAWQRYTKAVLAHRYDLARYLESFLKSARYTSLAQRYVSLDRNPNLLGNRDLFPERSAEISAVIAHAVRHQAKNDPRKALAHWEHYQQQHLFDVATRADVYTALARTLYDQGDALAVAQLVDQQSELFTVDFHEWRLRKLIGEGNWRGLLSGIETLPQALQEDPRWQYWYARASSLLGKNTQATQETYRALAQRRNFYGFMASDWLDNKNYQMEHKPPPVSNTDIDALSTLPAMLRVQELRYHGLLTEAHREWRASTNIMREEQLVVAAQLATRWQWHHQSIFAMIKASYWDDIDTRFPVLYREYFEDRVQQHQLPLPLIMALARQESAFNAGVVSPAGARGLMQLMPATARFVAKQHKIPYKKTAELFNPAKNIELGTQYYRDMLSRFGENRILATAAYNAGPHRVDRWLSTSAGKLPFDAWIETIPFKETRNYVQNVLAFSAIYSHHLNSNERILSAAERKRAL